MPPFFDPDRRLLSGDKLQHLVGGLGVGLGASLVVAWPLVLAVVFVVGAIFELGQWDAVRGTSFLGQPGYGFGPLDLAADVLGGVAAVLLWSVLT